MIGRVSVVIGAVVSLVVGSACLRPYESLNGLKVQTTENTGSSDFTSGLVAASSVSQLQVLYRLERTPYPGPCPENPAGGGCMSVPPGVPESALVALVPGPVDWCVEPTGGNGVVVAKTELDVSVQSTYHYRCGIGAARPAYRGDFMVYLSGSAIPSSVFTLRVRVSGKSYATIVDHRQPVPSVDPVSAFDAALAMEEAVPPYMLDYVHRPGHISVVWSTRAEACAGRYLASPAPSPTYIFEIGGAVLAVAADGYSTCPEKLWPSARA